MYKAILRSTIRYNRALEKGDSLFLSLSNVVTLPLLHIIFERIPIIIPSHLDRRYFLHNQEHG